MFCLTNTYFVCFVFFVVEFSVLFLRVLRAFAVISLLED